jgi:hypothetical protein
MLFKMFINCYGLSTILNALQTACPEYAARLPLGMLSVMLAVVTPLNRLVAVGGVAVQFTVRVVKPLQPEKA